MGHVPATVIVGAQWGDEGKGKIVDLLAQDSDLVCRYQGGPNAGHTIVVDGETYKIRQIPSRDHRRQGVRDRRRLRRRPQRRDRGARRPREPRPRRPRGSCSCPATRTSSCPGTWRSTARASAGSATSRSARPGAASGPPTPTRRRGSGSASRTCSTRRSCTRRSSSRCTEKNVWLERVYEIEPFDAEEVQHTYEGYAQRLRPYVADTSLLVDRALRERRQRALRRRAGNAARSRPRHVSVRHLVEPDRRRRRRQLRHRPEPDRRDPRRLEGVRDARRRGAVPVRDPGRGARARARARRRVRHRDGPRAALRLARPAGAALRGARQRHHLARADEARRALDVRGDPDLRALRRCRTGARRTTSRRTSRTSTTAARSGRRCPAGSRSSTAPSCPRRRRRTSASSRRRSASPSRSSAPGRAARPC